jgi:hypothetical protein
LLIPEDMFEPVLDVLLPLLMAELAAALFWRFLCVRDLWVVVVVAVESGVVAEVWPAFPVAPVEEG